MGGLGSGYQGTRKAAVEDGLTLSIGTLLQKGALTPGSITSGIWSWHYPGHEPHASMAYRADMRTPDAATLTLNYAVNGEPVEMVIRLDWTSPAYGGRRWWFLCPLERRDGEGPRRVAKLHLPPGARYFGSRQAYGLTHQSCRESGKYPGLYRLLAAELGADPDDIRKALRQM